MTNKHIKLSVISLSSTFNNFNVSERWLNLLPQQEAVILLLGSVQIFAANQKNFDKNSEL